MPLVRSREYGNFHVVQISEMLKGGCPLSGVVPNMIEEDTAHLLEICHRSGVPDMRKAMPRSVEYKRSGDCPLGSFTSESRTPQRGLPCRG